MLASPTGFEPVLPRERRKFKSSGWANSKSWSKEDGIEASPSVGRLMCWPLILSSLLLSVGVPVGHFLRQHRRWDVPGLFQHLDVAGTRFHVLIRAPTNSAKSVLPGFTAMP